MYRKKLKYVNFFFLHDQICFCCISSILRIGHFTIFGERLLIKTQWFARIVDEQWEFFNLSHLLWRTFSKSSRGPMTSTPVAERLEVELSLHVAVLSNYVYRDRDLNMLTNCAALRRLFWCFLRIFQQTLTHLKNLNNHTKCFRMTLTQWCNERTV